MSSRTVAISIIVVIYDMAREAPRTLHSLSREYQMDSADLNYEVIVMDNGSPQPLGEEVVTSFGDQFKYVYVKGASPSPARAINLAVDGAKGDVVGINVDGARMLTPGVLHYAQMAFALYPAPVVNTFGFHLGPELQQASVQKGYNRSVEDDLLTSIDWPHDGYRLFEISVLSGSCMDGLFVPAAESNCLFLTKQLYWEIGGMDERFDLPGGGFVNLDFYERAITHANVQPVVLLGEGTFHQIHGGASTSVTMAQLAQSVRAYSDQYESIRGRPYRRPNVHYDYLGHAPDSFLPLVEFSARRRTELRTQPEAAARQSPSVMLAIKTRLVCVLRRLRGLLSRDSV